MDILERLFRNQRFASSIRRLANSHAATGLAKEFDASSLTAKLAVLCSTPNPFWIVRMRAEDTPQALLESPSFHVSAVWLPPRG